MQCMGAQKKGEGVHWLVLACTDLILCAHNHTLCYGLDGISNSYQQAKYKGTSNCEAEKLQIKNNEVKLTGYAYDVSYFCKNKNSAKNVITKISNFSKISGLEINKTKSECLILNYENLQHTENVDGIPVVNNLKILGHYFGKEKIICNYNNFFSKLAKMEKIFNI